jgi:hypothetical protein
MIARAVIMLVIAAGTAIACWRSPQPRGGMEAGVNMRLPMRVGRLQGAERKPDKIETDVLPGDTEFAKMTYVTATNDANERDVAHVSIVLSGAESRSIHRPEVCLTGQGWTIAGSRIVPVEISPGRVLNVKDLSIEGIFTSKDGKPQRLRSHYVYWFVGTEFDTPSHFERLWRSTCDSVLHNINHRWAYVSVMASVTEDLDPAVCGERRRTDEQTWRLISFLIQQTVPQFQKDFISTAKTTP